MTSILQNGDWVKGNSMDGELVIGYIESINHLNELVKVKVITSDHEGIIGKSLSMFRKQLQKMTVTTVKTREEILSLIDLALTTGDEEWFIELTAELNSTRDTAYEPNKQR